MENSLIIRFNKIIQEFSIHFHWIILIGFAKKGCVHDEIINGTLSKKDLPTDSI